MKLSSKKISLSLILVLILVSLFSGCGQESVSPVDYSLEENWAYFDYGLGDADLFFVCPTVDMGRSGNYNMSLDDEKTKSSFVGATNMELGIYDDNAVVYAPYYQQVSFPVYSMTSEEAEPYFDIAYADVKAAFECYLESCDMERPLILAGFSQGADMVIRLMKDFGIKESVSDRLVAAYAIGWHLTEEEYMEYPWLDPARGESDTGCLVIFNSEGEDVTDSLLVAEGTWSYCINPLNWKTDSTPADASENLGACFPDYSGNLTEIPAYTGAYIDAQRGTLKCPDIDPAEYSNSMFPDGVYHLYDYQFFYRNLEENVAVRMKAWQDKH